MCVSLHIRSNVVIKDGRDFYFSFDFLKFIFLTRKKETYHHNFPLFGWLQYIFNDLPHLRLYIYVYIYKSIKELCLEQTASIQTCIKTQGDWLENLSANQL